MNTKYCKGCEKNLPLTDEFFASRYDKKNKHFQSLCRKCQKIYRKKHYENNKQKYIDGAKNYKKNFLLLFAEYKKTLKCEICSEDRPWVLDFHHKNPDEKEIEVSMLVRKCSKQKLFDEINKCIVLCANCHRDLHYNNRLNL